MGEDVYDVYRDKVVSAFIGWKAAEKAYNDKLTAHAAPQNTGSPQWVLPDLKTLDHEAADELERLHGAAVDQRSLYEQIRNQRPVDSNNFFKSREEAMALIKVGQAVTVLQSRFIVRNVALSDEVENALLLDVDGLAEPLTVPLSDITKVEDAA